MTVHAFTAPTHLRVENLVNPLGLGETKPRFSWVLSSREPNQIQTAWEIMAGSCPKCLARDEGSVWSSGRVEGGEVTGHVYQGPALASRQRVWWKVRAWDAQNRPSPWSEAAWFEMGLLQPDDWKARWICSSEIGTKWTSAPVPYFRREFQIGQTVVSARLYVTALGHAEARLNGQPVTQESFFPGWTHYHKRVQYRVYDVTSLLAPGANAVGFRLGDGWYCGHVANAGRQTYGIRPQVLAQLEIELADGSKTTVLTGPDWRTSTGAIREADMLMGEAWDARLEPAGWDRAGFAATEWHAACPGASVTAPLVAQDGPPVLPIEEVPAVGQPREFGGWNCKSFLFDLGQNITGRIRLRLRGSPGLSIKLRYAEMLGKDGRPYYENLRSARATDCYTFATNGEEVFEPVFTFHGFRYVELIVPDGQFPTPPASAVTGIVLHSVLAQTGHFECSNPLLNQLQKNIDWGMRGNYLDIPTDCPQRDERLGWTGDAQMFIRTGCFNRDIQTFFARWQQTIEDSQHGLGGLPPIIPDLNPLTREDGGDAGPAWSDALIICPYTIWLCYGDTRIIERHFASMMRYLDYLVAKSKDLIRVHPDVDGWGGFGDWLTLESETPKDLIGTAFLAYDADLLSQMATVIGRSAEAARYADLSRRVAAAFRRRFVTPEGFVHGNTQTAYVLALHFNLLEPEMRPQAARQLARLIEKRGHHLATGFVGTPYLCRALSDHGYADLAFRLLEETTYPSWLFPVTQGATTVWERWDGWTLDKGFQDPGMNSFNHYAYGSVGHWMYSTVAGLEVDPAGPGYGQIVFRPHVGGSLSFAEASLQTVRGPASIRWEKDAGRLRVRVEVPVTARATLHIPCGYLPEDRSAQRQIPLGSGQYQFLFPASPTA